jgi:lincosamide nucleotidyltransferase
MTAFKQTRQRILEAARTDPRILGCIDYGSTSEGRGDEWSDLDIALFIQDSELEAFEKNWKQWASQFGNLLLAYIGGIGHPWAVYQAAPLPLRVDFVFFPVSSLDKILEWPCSPTSVDAMVLYDETIGQIRSRVSRLVGQSLAPENLAQAFEQVGGDFWYYLLRTYTKLLRGEHWAARHDFNFIITGNLLALLRIEADAVSRWRGASASAGIEKVLSAGRLEKLNQCIPGPTETDLRSALLRAASLGSEVSENIAQKHSLDWPATLAKKVLETLG